MALFRFFTVGVCGALCTVSAVNAAHSAYKSRFTPPNQTAQRVLVAGKILSAQETAPAMMERVVATIAGAEKKYPQLALKAGMSTEQFAQELLTLMDDGAIVFSTPILTNAGRFDERPLSACAMPPIDLRADLKKIRSIVDKYHQDGMGTGYNLSDTDEPIKILKFLNSVAVAGSRTEHEHRPVGNMAILDVDSPHIEEFIMLKVGADDRGEEWKFNISVNVTQQFMDAADRDAEFVLKNGKKISARALFNSMAYAAHHCGDPGLISLERLNADNPTPSVCEYKTTAPCAEVGLAPGETCVFGYINLAQLLDTQKRIDFDTLQKIVTLLTRALDNVLELSIQRYSSPESTAIMQAKRKIGIGICGYADLLIALGIPYNDVRAEIILKDVLNFISYHSKRASVELARERGSFTAIAQSRYMDTAFITDKYGRNDTEHVSRKEWHALATHIKESQLLRNATTTSLPPTGRSALVIGASTGIEPLFSVMTPDGMYVPLAEHIAKHAHAITDPTINQAIAATGKVPASVPDAQRFITATELTPQEHLAVLKAAMGVIDESISKTINVPEETTPQEIALLYKKAFDAGLKGISVYRNNSRTFQPKKLSQDAQKE